MTDVQRPLSPAPPGDEHDQAAVETALARAVARLRAGRRIPRATYRLQFNREFTFRLARELADYLDALGVSDLYASPFLLAHADSTHGYDIVDHNALNPSIGTAADFDALAAELERRDLGLLLDMVPNHMGIDASDNRWWQEVLENGRASPFSGYFDIDWESGRFGDSDARVLLPILGDPYGRILERGELQLRLEGGAFSVGYWERRLPVDPKTYPDILSPIVDRLADSLAADDSALLELQSIITSARNLPERTETEADRVAERHREKEIVKRRLAALVDDRDDVRAAVETVVADVNGVPGEASSFDRLDALLRRQPYRLAYWRVAGEEINYRRFFDVNGLAGIRVEEPGVFHDTHALVLRLLAEGKLTGLRIDHPDGLWDPAGYLARLQRAYAEAVARRELTQAGVPPHAIDGLGLTDRLAEALGGASSDDWRRPLYVLVEKILSRGESLPPGWQCDGTTGYDFAIQSTGLFVDPTARAAFDRLYTSIVGRAVDFGELVNSSKKLLMLVAFPGDVNELGFLLKRIASRSRYYQDFTLNGLTFAVREVIAALPRYRTYRAGADGAIDPADRAAIESAISSAMRRNRRTARAIFEFIRDLLLLDDPAALPEEDRDLWCRFVMTFQQTTGPVMAKGVEDTAFYVYHRLVSLNEVGGEPDHFGVTVEEFHQASATRAAGWPHSMLATSTHDTKRGEDVRARIDALSEFPREWRTLVARWRRLNARHLGRIDGEPVPDANDEYLIYQTLVGAWPLEPMDNTARAAFTERMRGYMLKAVREAKAHSNWINPHDAYEQGVLDFVARLLDPKQSRGFLNSFVPFQARIAYFGMLNGLAQTLLKLTSPGVPDIYQGSELWNLSLVDPDNRRPVDYALRRRLLDDLNSRRRSETDRVALARELFREWPDGRVKLWTVVEALDLRRRHPDLFARGDYRPLEASGEFGEHVCAFARRHGHHELIVAVPRLTARLVGHEPRPSLGDVWGDGTLQLSSGGEHPTFRDVLTGRVVRPEPDGTARLADVFAHFPLAMLWRESPRNRAANGR